ncbi:MAG: peptidase M19 [Saprospirales bacterium]|nr:peptidase M19 [Saprospirales bacterium]
MKKILFWLFGSLAVLYMAVVLVVPTMIDKKYNTTANQPPYHASEAANTLYSSLNFIADLHCDALLWKRDLTFRHDFGHVDLPRMREACMSLQVFSIVTKTPKNMNFQSNGDDTDNITPLMVVQGRWPQAWWSLKHRVLSQCRQLKKFSVKSDGKFRVIESADDLVLFDSLRQNEEGVTAGLLAIEGAHCLEGQLDNLDDFYEAGVRMIGLTHFFDNELGGSAHGIEKGGLTDFGKRAVERMEELGIIIDLAHASPKLFADVMAMVKRPVVVSHTGVKGTCNNIRNLSDEQLRQVAARGGLVGIALFNGATCGSDAKAQARAIAHAVDVAGVDHVALGSDWDGAVKAHYDVTGLPMLVDELLRLGFTEGDIRKIMGENVKAFMRRNLPGS